MEVGTYFLYFQINKRFLNTWDIKTPVVTNEGLTILIALINNNNINTTH